MATVEKTAPKVSVVIPNYNHARFLRRRIDSVLQQTFQNFELVLLDDCSSDNSREILQSYASDPRVTLQLNTANSGSTFKQWNKGISLTQGEYIWIAESDDYAEPRFLELLVEALELDPAIAFAYCRSRRTSADDSISGFSDCHLSDSRALRWTADYVADGREECENYFVLCNIVPNASAVLFRKKVFEQVGGADERYKLCGDWKLWSAMALTGSVAYLAEPLNYHRFHEQSVRGKDAALAIAADESIRLIDWLTKTLSINLSKRDEIGQTLSNTWIAAIMSKGLPMERKWEIFRRARRLDPAAGRRLGSRVERELFGDTVANRVRNHLWYPMLDATVSMRQALGFRRKSK